MKPKFYFRWVAVIFLFFAPFWRYGLFCARVGCPRHPKNIFGHISPKPVGVQTSNLYQIVALNMLLKKGKYVHGAKFDT